MATAHWCLFGLRRTHDMLAILTDVRGVCLSVSLSATRVKSAPARAVYTACCVLGHLVQPLPNAFGLLFTLEKQQNNSV